MHVGLSTTWSGVHNYVVNNYGSPKRELKNKQFEEIQGFQQNPQSKPAQCKHYIDDSVTIMTILTSFT